jgi:phytoene dehydrogenase-like protein
MSGFVSAPLPQVLSFASTSCRITRPTHVTSTTCHAANLRTNRRLHTENVLVLAITSPQSSRNRRSSLARGTNAVPTSRLTTTTAAAAASNAQEEVIIVGAGVAGLNCAVNLHANGIPARVFEASDGLGGRVRTDIVEGFFLDRGFQIFLTSYPEARRALDYEDLFLEPFYAGALVRYKGAFHRVADPFRHLPDALASLPNAVGTPEDKLRVGLFRLKSLLGTVDEGLQAPEMTILERLREEGFSEAIIDRFFRPFLGGIFFDRDLGTTSRMFTFVMRMLATGQNCLPAAGIGSIPEQLAMKTPVDSIVLNARVASVKPAGDDGRAFPSITLADGTEYTAKAVVVATEGPQAEALLGDALASSPSKREPGVGTCCLYFAAPRPPMPGNVLYLDGENAGGLVNNCCFPSEVCGTYAPARQTLVSISTIGTRPELSDEALKGRVIEEMKEWFGAGEVSGWRHLRTYRIPFAQPNQAPPTDLFRPERLGDGLYVAGDHRSSATLDGALRSGRVAAEQVMEDLKGRGATQALAVGKLGNVLKA